MHSRNKVCRRNQALQRSAQPVVCCFSLCQRYISRETFSPLNAHTSPNCCLHLSSTILPVLSKRAVQFSRRPALKTLYFAGARLVLDSAGSQMSVSTCIFWRPTRISTHGLDMLAALSPRDVMHLKDWVGSHPSFVPCDVATNVSLSHWREPADYDSEFVWSLAPRAPFTHPNWDWPEKLVAMLRNDSNSVSSELSRQYFLLRGLVYKWKLLYGKIADKDSWAWQWYPEGQRILSEETRLRAQQSRTRPRPYTSVPTSV
jgi:hypothetical protein